MRLRRHRMDANASLLPGGRGRAGCGPAPAYRGQCGSTGRAGSRYCRGRGAQSSPGTPEAGCRLRGWGPLGRGCVGELLVRTQAGRTSRRQCGDDRRRGGPCGVARPHRWRSHADCDFAHRADRRLSWLAAIDAGYATRGHQTMSAVGTLYGLGVGPGDPELLTLKVLRIIRTAPVIAYPAPEHGASFARAIVSSYLSPAKRDIPIRIPMVS